MMKYILDKSKGKPESETDNSDFLKTSPGSITALASIGNLILGGMSNMFGFGESKIEKKELVKGIVDIVIDSYEKEISELRDKERFTIIEAYEKIDKLEEEVDNLKKEIVGLKEKKPNKRRRKNR